MTRNPALDAIVQRPVKQLALTTANNPGLWRRHDQARAEYSKRKSWPAWCYATAQVAAAAMYPDGTVESGPNDTLTWVIGANALAAWRLTKGIYLFDETVFNELWNTALDGILPVELLHRLPEWCVYVPFPQPLVTNWGIATDSWTGKKLTPRLATAYGFFAFLDWEAQTQTTWLHFCLDIDEPDDPDGLSLAGLTIGLVEDVAASFAPFRSVAQRAVQRLAAFVESDAQELRGAPWWQAYLTSLSSAATTWTHEQEVKIIRPMLSILLWLCSAKPEISPDPLRGFKTKKTKGEIRHFGPDEPRVYEVAYRIGAALRLDREAALARYGPVDGSHASPRPHIRRAHWHAFWTGPRAAIEKEQPTDRKLILKWVAPIFVCAGTDGDTIIPTVHPVLAEASQ